MHHQRMANCMACVILLKKLMYQMSPVHVCYYWLHDFPLTEPVSNIPCPCTIHANVKMFFVGMSVYVHVVTYDGICTLVMYIRLS